MIFMSMLSTSIEKFWLSELEKFEFREISNINILGNIRKVH
jgi:hypothetical protein